MTPPESHQSERSFALRDGENPHPIDNAVRLVLKLGQSFYTWFICYRGLIDINIIDRSLVFESKPY